MVVLVWGRLVKMRVRTNRVEGAMTKLNPLIPCRPARGLVLCVALIAFGSGTSAGPAGATAWPNPCGLLSRVHPQTSVAKGHHVAVKLGTVTKSSVETTCSESIGKLSIGLIIGPPSANNLSVPHVISESSVAGLGANATLVLGSSLEGGETNGLPLDYIYFYKAGLFVAVTVTNGTTTKIALTDVASALYRLVR
jgi:hypothetical protein